MNQKSIAILLLIISIISIINIFTYKNIEDDYIYTISLQQGSCFLDNGSCLHAERPYTPYILQAIISLSLIITAIYLLFFNKNQNEIIKKQEEITKTLYETKKVEGEKNQFEAYLSGFKNDEQIILKAIKEQEGIQQSTLRFRTGMSKATLSLILKSLEDRKIINKEPYKKTNKLYLIKKF